MKKIFVFCPGNVVTGGIELLHQFVDEARSVGADAVLVYFPIGTKYSKPDAYAKYNSPQGEFIDGSDSLVIIPESATKLAIKIKYSKICVWWMSVDNYFYFPQNNTIKNPLVIDGNKLYDPLRYLKSIFRRIPLGEMKSYAHFAQSNYAADFLKSEGIDSKYLTDYLSDEHLDKIERDDIKENIVVYNPKKGYSITKYLIEKNCNVKFIPIENMTSIEVVQLMTRAKLYIDFGNHPGKDRPPREAVMANCCVITGLSGSAKYYKDVPIPSKYKINTLDKDFLGKFQTIMNECFDNYEKNILDFKEWRKQIKNEKYEFKQQVYEIVNRHKDGK